MYYAKFFVFDVGQGNSQYIWYPKEEVGFLFDAGSSSALKDKKLKFQESSVEQMMSDEQKKKPKFMFLNSPATLNNTTLNEFKDKSKLPRLNNLENRRAIALKALTALEENINDSSTEKGMPYVELQNLYERAQQDKQIFAQDELKNLENFKGKHPNSSIQRYVEALKSVNHILKKKTKSIEAQSTTVKQFKRNLLTLKILKNLIEDQKKINHLKSPRIKKSMTMNNNKQDEKINDIRRNIRTAITKSNIKKLFIFLSHPDADHINLLGTTLAEQESIIPESLIKNNNVLLIAGGNFFTHVNEDNNVSLSIEALNIPALFPYKKAIQIDRKFESTLASGSEEELIDLILQGDVYKVITQELLSLDENSFKNDTETTMMDRIESPDDQQEKTMDLTNLTDQQKEVWERIINTNKKLKSIINTNKQEEKDREKDREKTLSNESWQRLTSDKKKEFFSALKTVKDKVFIWGMNIVHKDINTQSLVISFKIGPQFSLLCTGDADEETFSLILKKIETNSSEVLYNMIFDYIKNDYFRENPNATEENFNTLFFSPSEESEKYHHQIETIMEDQLVEGIRGLEKKYNLSRKIFLPHYEEQGEINIQKGKTLFKVVKIKKEERIAKEEMAIELYNMNRSGVVNTEEKRLNFSTIRRQLQGLSQEAGQHNTAIVPHHGSDNNLSLSMFECFLLNSAVISSGNGQVFGHANTNAIDFLKLNLSDGNKLSKEVETENKIISHEKSESIKSHIEPSDNIISTAYSGNIFFDNGNFYRSFTGSYRHNDQRYSLDVSRGHKIITQGKGKGNGIQIEDNGDNLKRSIEIIEEDKIFHTIDKLRKFVKVYDDDNKFYELSEVRDRLNASGG